LFAQAMGEVTRRRNAKRVRSKSGTVSARLEGAREAAPTRSGSMVDLLAPSAAALMIAALGQTLGSDTREGTRMKIDGRCHCGEITFEAEVDPDALNICHCTDCQTLSGSAFRVNIPAPAERFVLHGTPKTYIKTAESGNRRQQTFCPNCGTPIYSAPASGDTKVVVLRVGAIRQRAELIPRDQFWFRSSQPWLPNLSTIKKQEKQPAYDERGVLRDS